MERFPLISAFDGTDHYPFYKIFLKERVYAEDRQGGNDDNAVFDPPAPWSAAFWPPPRPLSWSWRPRWRRSAGFHADTAPAIFASVSKENHGIEIGIPIGNSQVKYQDSHNRLGERKRYFEKKRPLPQPSTRAASRSSSGILFSIKGTGNDDSIRPQRRE